MWSVMHRLAAGAVVGIVALNVAAADAAIVYATVTGTVTDDFDPGIDTLGFFATPGTSLVNQAFSAQFVFDTTLAGSTFTDGATTTSLSWFGAGAAVALTINGRSISFDTTGFIPTAALTVSNASGVGDEVRLRVNTGSYFGYNGGTIFSELEFHFRSVIDDFTSSFDPAVPFTYVVANPSLETAVYSGFLNTPSEGIINMTLNLDVTSITLSDTGSSITAPNIQLVERLSDDPDPVDMPEPTTFAIIGLGVACLGLARRRRAVL